jgi:hypothetical protein
MREPVVHSAGVHHEAAGRGLSSIGSRMRPQRATRAERITIRTLQQFDVVRARGRIVDG